MNQPHEILIADADLADLHILLDGLAPHVAVHLVQSGDDGVASIFDALANPALDKLHLLAHGTPGGIVLGGKEIRAADFLGRYDGSAQRDLDIAFWSCRTGAGVEGQAFVRAVAQATGARVAASADLIGQGGSWHLDVAVPAPFSAAARAQFPHALDVQGYLFYYFYPDGLHIYDLVTSLQGILTAENHTGMSYDIYTVRLVDSTYTGNIASEINSVVALSHTGYWSVNVDATQLPSLVGTGADMVTLLTSATNNQITFSGTETLTITSPATIAQGEFLLGYGQRGSLTFSQGVADTVANLLSVGNSTVLDQTFQSYAIYDTTANVIQALGNSDFAGNATSINVVDTVDGIKQLDSSGDQGQVSTVNIVDSAANILANATDAAVTSANTISLVQGDSTASNLSAAQAITLFDTLHTASNGNSYTILDTAANLLAAGTDPALTGASAVTLAANDSGLANLSVESARLLFDTLHAGLNGNTYSVTDSAANLLNSWWDGAVSQAASITLAAHDSTLAGLNVGQAQTLFDTLHAAMNGNTYSITDTASALLGAATDSAVTGAASITLASGDTGLSGLTASSAATLFDTLHAALNGNTYTIADTAHNLLASATDPAVTGAASIKLAAGDSTLSGISVSDAETLFDTLHAGLNGNTYSIADTAAHLMANAGDAAVTGASTLGLSANASLSLADAGTLAALPHFSLNGHSLNLADSIANLDGHTGDYGATSYSVLDSAADILAVSSGSLVAGATAVSLTADASLSVADATTLASLNSFSTDGHTLSLVDSIANLNGHLTIAGASSYEVLDTAPDILAAAGNSVVIGATGVEMSADASLSVANAGALAAIANFGLNGHTLSLADSIANLTGNLATGGATAYSVVDSAANIAQFNSADNTWTVSGLVHDGIAISFTDAVSPAELAAIKAADPSGALQIVPTNLSTPNAFIIADAGTPSFSIPFGTAANVIAAPGDETIEIAQGGKLKLTGTDGHDTIIFDGYLPGSLAMTQSGTTAVFTDTTTHAVIASISMDSTYAAAETIQYADGSQALVTLVGTPLTLHLTPLLP